MRDVSGGLFGRFGADVLDVVAPRDCVCCAEPGRTLCARCAHVTTSAYPVIDDRRTSQPVAIGGWLEGVLGDVVRAYKSGSGRGLARPLGLVLAAAVEHVLDGSVDREPYGLIAIPPSLRAQWSRGDDVLGRVVDRAVGVLRHRGHPVARWRLLSQARQVRDQRDLGARSRQLNVVDSLIVRPRALAQHQRRSAGARGPVIVVDDVMTTGATMREAIRALQAAGLAEQIVGGAVIAATRDRAMGMGRDRTNVPMSG